MGAADPADRVTGGDRLPGRQPPLSLEDAAGRLSSPATALSLSLAVVGGASGLTRTRWVRAGGLGAEPVHGHRPSTSSTRKPAPAQINRTRDSSHSSRYSSSPRSSTTTWR